MGTVLHTQALTLITADAFEADAAVAGSRHMVTGGVVHALTKLLAPVAKRPRWTLCGQRTTRLLSFTHLFKKNNKLRLQIK